MTQNEMWILKEKYNGEKTEGFFTDCARVSSGEPLAYVIGFIPFLNTKIYLDLSAGQAGSHPLIPRTETEFWVSKIITKINSFRGSTPKLRILDLCAGSGCIGIAVLKEIESTRVDFVEIDTGHHPTILKNIVENGIDSSRAQIFEGNLFENVTEQYDYILTNPPYVDPVLDRVESSVKKYEPKIALYGGKNGLEIITDIIEKSPIFLKKNGVLIIEHEPEQSKTISTKAHSVGFCADTYPDQFGVLRYTTLTRKHNEPV